MPIELMRTSFVRGPIVPDVVSLPGGSTMREGEMSDHERDVLVKREDGFVTITMNRPQRRNALSKEHMAELLAAFRSAGASDARGVILAGNGPVFCSGHDFADVAGA